MNGGLFAIEIALVIIFLVLFYQTKIRGLVEKVVWIILVLIIYFSYLDITTPSPDSFNLSGLLTVFLAFGMAVLVLISLIILGILVMKKFIEKRIDVK
jgi:hypothetical protein